MDSAFTMYFEKRNSIIDEPELQVSDYLSKKMSLYLNKALSKVTR